VERNARERAKDKTLDNFEMAAKLLASGGLTVVLLYASITLWTAYQNAVKGRIDDLNARIEKLEKSEETREAETKTAE